MPDDKLVAQFVEEVYSIVKKSKEPDATIKELLKKKYYEMFSGKDISDKYVNEIRTLSNEFDTSEEIVKEMFKKKYYEKFSNTKISTYIPLMLTKEIRDTLGYSNVKKKKQKQLDNKLEPIEKASGLKKKERKSFFDLLKKLKKK